MPMDECCWIGCPDTPRWCSQSSTLPGNDTSLSPTSQCPVVPERLLDLLPCCILLACVPLEKLLLSQIALTAPRSTTPCRIHAHPAKLTYEKRKAKLNSFTSANYKIGRRLRIAADGGDIPSAEQSSNI